MKVKTAEIWAHSRRLFTTIVSLLAILVFAGKDRHDPNYYGEFAQFYDCKLRAAVFRESNYAPEYRHTTVNAIIKNRFDNLIVLASKKTSSAKSTKQDYSWLSGNVSYIGDQIVKVDVFFYFGQIDYTFLAVLRSVNSRVTFMICSGACFPAFDDGIMNGLNNITSSVVIVVASTNAAVQTRRFLQKKINTGILTNNNLRMPEIAAIYQPLQPYTRSHLAQSKSWSLSVYLGYLAPNLSTYQSSTEPCAPLMLTQSPSNPFHIYFRSILRGLNDSISRQKKCRDIFILIASPPDSTCGRKRIFVERSYQEHLAELLSCRYSVIDVDDSEDLREALSASSLVWIPTVTTLLTNFHSHFDGTAIAAGPVSFGSHVSAIASKPRRLELLASLMASTEIFISTALHLGIVPVIIPPPPLTSGPVVALSSSSEYNTSAAVEPIAIGLRHPNNPREPRPDAVMGLETTVGGGGGGGGDRKSSRSNAGSSSGQGSLALSNDISSLLQPGINSFAPANSSQLIENSIFLCCNTNATVTHSIRKMRKQAQQTVSGRSAASVEDALTDLIVGSLIASTYREFVAHNLPVLRQVSAQSATGRDVAAAVAVASAVSGSEKGGGVANSSSMTVLTQTPSTTPAEKNRTTAVIIEPRIDFALEFCVRNALVHLGPSWRIEVHYSQGATGNEAFVKAVLDKLPRVHFVPLPFPINDGNSYNKLIKSAKFWARLQESADKVLFFQTDSLLLRQGIDDFMSYDYVGAPWPVDATAESTEWIRQAQKQGTLKEGVGNGGFSLRSVEPMLKIATQFGHRNHHSNEDTFFVNHVERMKGSRLPARRTAYEFAVEMPCSDLNMSIDLDEVTGKAQFVPFGIHSIWAYVNRDDAKKILELSMRLPRSLLPEL